MSHDRNSETLDVLKTEIKALQENCVNTCRVIENAPPESPSSQMVDGDQVEQKINAYFKGLENAVHNTNTIVPTDSNLLTTQFLIDIKQKTVQVEELSAYTAGVIHDLDAEISRLKNLISVAEEAKSKHEIQKNVVQPEHYLKAKEQFRMMKTSVHHLIQSLLPHNYEDAKSVLGELMAANLNNSSDDYIPISPEKIDVIQILKDMNIVTVNPYNQYECKLNC